MNFTNNPPNGKVDTDPVTGKKYRFNGDYWELYTDTAIPIIIDGGRPSDTIPDFTVDGGGP